MTDYAQLIEQLRLYPSPTIHRAADAIEALQARVLELKSGWQQSVQSYVEAIGQRDSALAKLAALEKQEPVGEVEIIEFDEAGEDASAWVSLHNDAKLGDKLYLAAGAQAQPLTEGTAAGYLKDLCAALDGAFISSWQSTHAWQKELDAAKEYLSNKIGGSV